MAPTAARIARVVLLVGLAWFYVHAATAAARVNTSKARADQSGYLWDAERIYANWHGRTPQFLIGERERGVVYPAFLAIFYDPHMSDAEFFEAAKAWNIRLSLVLLALLGLIFSFYLPPFLSTNLLLVVAFGYFVFKAGYTQVELLLYFLMFMTFLAACHFLVADQPARSVALGAITGVLAGITHLTKAVMPPFIALLLSVVAVQEIARLVQRKRAGGDDASSAWRQFLWRAASTGVLCACFLATVFPYIANSKRVFGEYFYNTNTAIYMWYDTGGEARAMLLPRTDDRGVVSVAQSELPTWRTYWHSHTVGQIAARFEGGLADLVERSYTAFGFWPYLVMYLAFAAALIVRNAGAFAAFVRSHAALVAFLVLYGAVYLLTTAFFVPTSSTGGMRFLLAHIAPLLFALSMFIARAPFSNTEWRVVGIRVTPWHFNALVAGAIAVDLAAVLWPRLLTTYGGF